MNNLSLNKIALWCAMNCPPMAWNAIVLKTMDEIRKRHNYWLINLMKPQEDMTIDEHCFSLISSEVFRLYGLSLTQEMIANQQCVAK